MGTHTSSARSQWACYLYYLAVCLYNYARRSSTLLRKFEIQTVRSSFDGTIWKIKKDGRHTSLLLSKTSSDYVESGVYSHTLFIYVCRLDGFGLKFEIQICSPSRELCGFCCCRGENQRSLRAWSNRLCVTYIFDGGLLTIRGVGTTFYTYFGGSFRRNTTHSTRKVEMVIYNYGRRSQDSSS